MGAHRTRVFSPTLSSSTLSGLPPSHTHIHTHTQRQTYTHSYPATQTRNLSLTPPLSHTQLLLESKGSQASINVSQNVYNIFHSPAHIVPAHVNLLHNRDVPPAFTPSSTWRQPPPPGKKYKINKEHILGTERERGRRGRK